MAVAGMSAPGYAVDQQACPIARHLGKNRVPVDLALTWVVAVHLSDAWISLNAPRTHVIPQP